MLFVEPIPEAVAIHVLHRREGPAFARTPYVEHPNYMRMVHSLEQSHVSAEARGRSFAELRVAEVFQIQHRDGGRFSALERFGLPNRPRQIPAEWEF